MSSANTSFYRTMNIVLIQINVRLNDSLESNGIDDLEPEFVVIDGISITKLMFSLPNGHLHSPTLTIIRANVGLARLFVRLLSRT